jgi:hypothetical protein
VAFVKVNPAVCKLPVPVAFVNKAFTRVVTPVTPSVDAKLTAPVTFTVEDIFTAPVALRVAVCRFPLEVAFVKVKFVEETLPPFILNTPEPVALVKNKLPIEIEEVAEVPVAFVIVTVSLKAAVELTFKVFAESKPLIVVEAIATTPPDCEIVLLKVAPAWNAEVEVTLSVPPIKKLEDWKRLPFEIVRVEVAESVEDAAVIKNGKLPARTEAAVTFTFPVPPPAVPFAAVVILP